MHLDRDAEQQMMQIADGLAGYRDPERDDNPHRRCDEHSAKLAVAHGMARDMPRPRPQALCRAGVREQLFSLGYAHRDPRCTSVSPPSPTRSISEVCATSSPRRQLSSTKRRIALDKLPL